MRVAAALSVAEGGFSLHAATTAAADDAAGREALCKYVLRPPLAQERLHLLDDGLVRIETTSPDVSGHLGVISTGPTWSTFCFGSCDARAPIMCLEQ
jgi:hypothetical protein